MREQVETIRQGRSYGHAKSPEGLQVSTPKTVLLVEDNDDDVLLIKRACDRSGIPHTLDVAYDGEAAIQYLTACGRPGLVFLDLNLPKRSGFAVLKWMRSRPGLAEIPVTILSSSTDRSDIEMAYLMGVTYLAKTGDQKKFKQAVGIVLKYWLTRKAAED